jgi:hypothetical protein
MLLGLVCLVVGGIFVWQSFDVKAQVTNQMKLERATYGSDTEYITLDGELILYNETIEGIIDTEREAKLMADTLKAHRLDPVDGYPPYTETERDNPDRQTILNGITIENSLGIAQMGYGISTMVLGIGAFMLVVGIALGGVGWALKRQG